MTTPILFMRRFTRAMIVRNGFFIAVVPVLIAGCGPQRLMPTPNLYMRGQKDPFAQVPAEFQTNTVDVVYVTDRESQTDKSGALSHGSERSTSLGYGLATVNIGRDISWPDLVKDSRTQHRQNGLPLWLGAVHEQGRFPSTPLAVVEEHGVVRESPQALRDLAAAQQKFGEFVGSRLARTPNKDAYVFVHGFNNTFEDAAFVIAELWHFMGRQGVPFINTWPAGRSYAYDRESGEYTVFHFKQFLRALAACPELRSINIIAHSRGTDVTLTTLRELNIACRAAGQDTRAQLKLGTLILAAADLDLQVISPKFLTLF